MEKYICYALSSKVIQFFDLFNAVSTSLFSIAMVLVLLSFENMTNTNTILSVGIVFQYNTNHIVHLWFAGTFNISYLSLCTQKHFNLSLRIFYKLKQIYRIEPKLKNIEKIDSGLLNSQII